MDRPLTYLLGGVLVAFGLVAFLKRAAVEESTAAGPTAVDRRRIQSFWERYHRANSLRLEGRFEEALAAYRSSLELDPKHEDSLYYLGVSLKEVGEYAEAVATFERMTQVSPESSRAWTELGATLALRAPGWTPDFDRASAAFHRSIEINREEAGPFLRLGLLELDQGRLPQARDQFRIAAGFGSPEGNFQVGYTLFLDKNYREAAGWFRKALATYETERKIVARGVLSEGDVLPAPGKPLTAIEKAGLKAMLFLYWTARRTGAKPDIDLTPAPAQSRLRVETVGSDAPVADVDRDGQPDRLLYRWRRPLVFESGSADRTAAAGLKGLRALGYSALFFDYDRDGWPDLLLATHAPYEEVVRCLLQPAYRTDRHTPRLFHNKGDGTFEEVTARVGLHRAYGVLQAAAADVDSDGWPDLVLATGGLDNQRLEPSVVLRNIEGRQFQEWRYVPSFDDPRRATAVARDGSLVAAEPPAPPAHP